MKPVDGWDYKPLANLIAVIKGLAGWMTPIISSPVRNGQAQGHRAEVREGLPGRFEGGKELQFLSYKQLADKSGVNGRGCGTPPTSISATSSNMRIGRDKRHPSSTGPTKVKAWIVD